MKYNYDLTLISKEVEKHCSHLKGAINEVDQAVVFTSLAKKCMLFSQELDRISKLLMDTAVSNLENKNAKSNEKIN